MSVEIKNPSGKKKPRKNGSKKEESQKTSIVKESSVNSQRRTIEIVSSYSGKLSTGNYENESPFFSIKEVIEDCDWNDSQIQSRHRELNESCYRNFMFAEQYSRRKAIQKQLQNIRFYPVNGSGLFYPSVSSIIYAINPQKFNVSENRLRALGARGSVVHLIYQKFIETGKWIEANQIPEAIRYLKIMKAEKVELEGDLPAFLEKYPHTYPNQLTEIKVYNHEYKYAGRYDSKGIRKESGKLGIQDVKTGAFDATEAFKQLAAYAKCEGNEDVEELEIIPIHGKTKQGYSKPTVTDKIDEYFTMFLQDREEFEKTFAM